MTITIGTTRGITDGTALIGTAVLTGMQGGDGTTRGMIRGITDGTGRGTGITRHIGMFLIIVRVMASLALPIMVVLTATDILPATTSRATAAAPTVRTHGAILPEEGITATETAIGLILTRPVSPATGGTITTGRTLTVGRLITPTRSTATVAAASAAAVRSEEAAAAVVAATSGDAGKALRRACLSQYSQSD